MRTCVIYIPWEIHFSLPSFIENSPNSENCRQSKFKKIDFTSHVLSPDPQVRKATGTSDEFFNPEHISEPPVRQ